MLPKAARLTRSADFTVAVRRGRRCGRSTLVVHLLAGEPEGATETLQPARAGFVVGKSVGGAVVRNTVSRRLRALVGDRLAAVPAGSSLVVRALPAAASASSATLASDLDRCLQRLLGAGPTPAPGGAA